MVLRGGDGTSGDVWLSTVYCGLLLRGSGHSPAAGEGCWDYRTGAQVVELRQMHLESSRKARKDETYCVLPLTLGLLLGGWKWIFPWRPSNDGCGA